MPATQGVVPQLVERADLQQANAVMAFSRRGAMTLGPAVAGVLVATVGPGWAILADATGYALGALALSRVRLPAPEPRRTLAADTTTDSNLANAAGDPARVPSLWTQLREGWIEVRSRTWLWVIIAVFGVVNAVHVGAWAVLGPVIAKNSPGLGARGWGLVVSAEAVGAIVMTMPLMRLPLNWPLRQGMVGVAVMAIPLCLLGVRPETLVIGLGALFAGAGMEIFGTGWNVALMEQIPQDALSRVASFDMLGSFLVIPAGTLFYGWLATRANLEKVLIVRGRLRSGYPRHPARTQRPATATRRRFPSRAGPRPRRRGQPSPGGIGTCPRTAHTRRVHRCSSSRRSATSHLLWRAPGALRAASSRVVRRWTNREDAVMQIVPYERRDAEVNKWDPLALEVFTFVRVVDSDDERVVMQDPEGNEFCVE